MRFTDYRVRVITRASRQKILEEEGFLRAWVVEPPERGAANRALVDLLAGHFGLKRSSVGIRSGFKSSRKTVRIYHRQ